MSRKPTKHDTDPTEERDRSDDDVVLLRDLAPRKDVKGGAKKLTFGQNPGPTPPRGGRRRG